MDITSDKQQRIQRLEQKISSIAGLFMQSIQQLAADFQQVFLSSATQNLTTGILCSPELRLGLQTAIQPRLENDPYCHGAGFASYIDEKQTNSEYWLLEWWLKQPTSDHLQLELDQGTQQRLDFRTFEWFNHTECSQTPYIHGPYVDYICSTAYTLTAAQPIYVNQQFMGVAVMDLLVATFEECISEELKLIDDVVCITNQEGRVIVSNTAKYRIGSLIHDNQVQAYQKNTYAPFHLYFSGTLH